jgi:hypothetical protein
MENDGTDNNGYDELGDSDSNSDYKDQILELCKLAQGNITTIYWCKQQIRKRLKILDRLVEKLSKLKKQKNDSQSADTKQQVETVIKKQTDACKNLGIKIQEEIESLEQIRIAAKSFGIDIKTRLLELDDKLDGDDVNSFFDESE